MSEEPNMHEGCAFSRERATPPTLVGYENFNYLLEIENVYCY